MGARLGSDVLNSGGKFWFNDCLGHWIEHRPKWEGERRDFTDVTLVLNNEDQEKTGGKVDGGKGREGDTRRGGRKWGRRGFTIGR